MPPLPPVTTATLPVKSNIVRVPTKAGKNSRYAARRVPRTVDYQGRVRFGAPYSPKFHYDCTLSPRGNREFVSCHGRRKVKRGQTYVNIAPNDNIRYI